MLYKVRKDRKRRINFAKVEKSRLILKMLKTNCFLRKEVRNYSSFFLEKDNNYFVRIRNSCILTGRSRGLVQDFKISRMCFKEFANKGFLEGVRKSSW